jgi:hypothetical protein
MPVINNVDIGNVVKEAMSAAKETGVSDWASIKDVVKHISDNMLSDLKYVAKKKFSGEFDEFDGKIFLEDQKMVARTRLRSIAIMTLKTAERILNAIVDVFKGAANTALGWDIF